MKEIKILKRIKRAQSEIIVTILLILLVLAAIVVVYQVVIRVIRGSAENVDSEIMTIQLGIVKDSVYINYVSDKLQLIVNRGSDKSNVSSIKIVVLGKEDTSEENAKTHIEIRTKEIPKSLEYRIYVLDISGFKKDSITKIIVYPVSLKGKVGIGYTYTVKQVEQGTSPGRSSGEGTGGESGGGSEGGSGWYEDDTQTGETGDESVTYYKDADSDGYSDGVTSTSHISNYYLPDELISLTGDCDDINAKRYPSAATASGADFNSDGKVDVNDRTIMESWICNIMNPTMPMPGCNLCRA